MYFLRKLYLVRIDFHVRKLVKKAIEINHNCEYISVSVRGWVERSENINKRLLLRSCQGPQSLALLGYCYRGTYKKSTYVILAVPRKWFGSADCVQRDKKNSVYSVTICWSEPFSRDGRYVCRNWWTLSTTWKCIYFCWSNFL